MKEKQSRGFADRFRLGLKGDNCKDTMLVYVLNLTILLFFYITTIPWVKVEDDYYTFLPIVILILVGSEYIITTAVLDRAESNNPFEEAVPKPRRHKLVSYLLETKTVPCNLRIAIPALAIMILFGAFYMSFIDRTKQFEVTRESDGNVLVSLEVDSPKTEGKDTGVWAVVMSEKMPSYYLTRVDSNQGTWRVLIDRSYELSDDDTLQLEYYIDAFGSLTGNRIRYEYPFIGGSQRITRTANMKDQKIQTSYSFLK